MVPLLASDPESVGSFDLFELKPSIHIDEEILRQKFYSLSKQFHPDRFVQSPPSEAIKAARWSTRLNRAYQELRDRQTRALLLLAMFGKNTSKKTGVPLALAETYFELQEASEDSNRSERLTEFRKQLAQIKTDLESRWSTLSTQWSVPPSPEQVASLQELVDETRYLASMMADVEKQLGSTQ